MNPHLQLTRLQQRGLAVVQDLGTQDVRRQYHPELSPLGWHLGHMAVVEAYWLREVVLASAIPGEWKRFYFPESSPKPARAGKLPAPAALLTFAQDLHRTHSDLLADPPPKARAHSLWRDNYLLHFFIQHHSQHLETMQQVLLERALARAWPRYDVTSICEPQAPVSPALVFTEDEATIGHVDGPTAFDNELPRHTMRVSAFAIGSMAVTNAEYLGFMQSGGYAERCYWSEPGWAWRERAQIRAPHHWRQDAAGHWYGITPTGPTNLAPQAAVYGINYYEAEAFARYAGCRLPSEPEWEYAASRSALLDGVQTWEWCANRFYPYPGFRAFPYEGYSTPWFGSHYALRGGGPYTEPCIKRASFRNFYTPDKRHIFAGVRLAATR